MARRGGPRLGRRSPGSSKGWANAHELTLAREFVDRLDEPPRAAASERETGACSASVTSRRGADDRLAADAADAAEGPVGPRPDGPGGRSRPSPRARRSPAGSGWTRRSPRRWCRSRPATAAAGRGLPVGKFTLPLADAEAGKLKASAFADALAEGVLGRLVRRPADGKGPKVKGKPTYKVRIDNASPLILNGLAVLGTRPRATSREAHGAGRASASRRGGA